MYPDNVQMTLEALDKKIEEITEYYEKNVFPYVHSEHEYSYMRGSYLNTIKSYVEEKTKIFERSCPRMIITTETMEEKERILKLIKEQEK